MPQTFQIFKIADMPPGREVDQEAPIGSLHLIFPCIQLQFIEYL